MIHRGEKGFTLIELLVVIAILGVIAAVVALSVAGFFGRGTLQAANTELHQAQTAIIAAMADAETNLIDGAYDAQGDPIENWTVWWAGESEIIEIRHTDATKDNPDAASYIYGPFRATYLVDATGAIIYGVCHEDHKDAGDDVPGTAEAVECPTNPWGPTIVWGDNNSWINADDD